MEKTEKEVVIQSACGFARRSSSHLVNLYRLNSVLRPCFAEETVPRILLYVGCFKLTSYSPFRKLDSHLQRKSYQEERPC